MVDFGRGLRRDRPASKILWQHAKIPALHAFQPFTQTRVTMRPKSMGTAGLPVSIEFSPRVTKVALVTPKSYSQPQKKIGGKQKIFRSSESKILWQHAKIPALHAFQPLTPGAKVGIFAKCYQVPTWLRFVTIAQTLCGIAFQRFFGKSPRRCTQILGLTSKKKIGGRQKIVRSSEAKISRRENANFSFSPIFL